MDTYWEDFINNYREILPRYPLITILEAFWVFCNLGKIKETADEIFQNYDVMLGILPENNET